MMGGQPIRTAAQDIENPSDLQRRAADPRVSVWVGASAGSGKTKVLTDRLLRLLLPVSEDVAGTEPHRILCLTFTKAAASEMALRLGKRLRSWAVMDEAALGADMTDLLGRTPRADEIEAARGLFAMVVDAPGGLKIMTLHGFCQSILGRFPLEAGLPPAFKVLEDGAARSLMDSAQDYVLTRAAAGGGELAAALELLAGAQSEDGFEGLIEAVLKEKHQLELLVEEQGGFEGLCAQIYKTLGVRVGETEEDLLRAACADGAFDMPGLRGVCRALAELGTKTEQTKSLSLQLWLDATECDRIGTYRAYSRLFLTQDGKAFAKLATKAVLSGAPEVEGVLIAETDRILAVEDALKRCRAARLTCALLALGRAVDVRYNTLKTTQSALDFDDLITRTLSLLTRRDMAGWVMFKLDGGLDHILIDEAQDTNPEQWRIIQSLCEDFFAGSGARDDVTRTLFTVGDEKQSIYSFQRAAPEKFIAMRDYFSARVQGSGRIWRNEAMAVSFRSAPEILRFVDDVFAPDEVRQGLGSAKMEHRAFRTEMPGMIELWPLFNADVGAERDIWAPLSRPAQSRSGAARLAEHTARTIETWLKTGEILPSQNRSIRPGDILILVRSRTAFVGQLIRALKTLNIPVSGLDRMVLKDQLPVKDLLAGAQFALLPQDDLSLASFLKSPFIGWNDDDLMRYAIGRKRGVCLWQSLSKNGRNKPETEHILSYLDKLIYRASVDHPYEFFSRILQEPCPASPQGGLYALSSRLGEEALDPVDEFLNLALAVEQEQIPALQSFITTVQQGDSQVKREQEEAGGQVRIMTVHGAKGLEAPIVILPDTVRSTRTPPGASSHRLIWPDKSGLKVPLWSPRSDDDPAPYRVLLDALSARQDEEYRRLLYVAMTRARDRLYIGGARTSKNPISDSWYNYMKAAMENAASVAMEPFTSLSASLSQIDENEEPPLLYRIGNKGAMAGVVPAQSGAADPALDIKAYPWLFKRPLAEPVPPKPLVPSRPAVVSPPAASPLAGISDEYRFRRGIVTHRLLQLIPDLPLARRADAIVSFITRHGADLPRSVQENIAVEVHAILNHPDFGDVFGPAALAEVPVTGMVGGFLVSGQIDRMLIRTDEILIVDYKTNRPPPQDPKDVPEAYKLQLKAYSDIVAKIYEGKTIRTFLLWTDGPRLMEVQC